MKMRKAAKMACSAILTVLLTVSAVNSFAAAVKTGETAEEKMLNFSIIREARPLDEEVTCAQYSAMLVRALGLDEVALSYTDGDWSQGYVALAEKLRFYQSLPDSITPHETITVENAVVMTVAALGYDVTAGKSAAEQYNVGIRIGLYQGVSAPAKEVLVRADAYSIISNALDTDLCVSENYAADGRYMIDKDNTLMSMLLDLKDRVYYEGVVEASHAVSLTGAKVKDGEVMIDGTSFYAGDSGAERFVGSRVSFYADYENDSDYGEIQWISPHRKNSSISLDETADKAIAEGKLEYYPDEASAKTETFSIEPSAQVMFNNRPLGRPLVNEDVEDNRITLIDNDADEVYDVLLITEIESYLVKRCYPEQDFIAFEDSAAYQRGGLEFETGDKDYVYEFYDEAGERIELEDIGTGDAVSVIAGKDMKYVALHRLADPVSGRVTEYSEADLSVLVDSQPYALVKGAPAIEAGADGNFYIDLWGRIFDVRESVDSYVYISGVDQKKGISQQALIRVFTNDNGFVTYETAENVTIDGDRIKGSDDVMTYLRADAVANISVNAEGRVSRIDYAEVYGERGSRTYVEHDFGFTDYTDKVLTPFACGKGQTAVFFIPKSGLEDEYFNTFPLNDDEDYIVTGYDLDERSGKVRAVTVEMDVRHPTSVGFGSSSKFLAVNSVRQIYSGDSSTYKLEGICEGETVTLQAAQVQSVFNVLSTLDKGDVLQFVLNWDGEIGLARKALDYSTLSKSYYDTSDNENTQLFAPVAKVNENVMTNFRKYLAHEVICEVDGTGKVPSTVSASEEKVSGTDDDGFNNYFVYDAKRKMYRAGSIDSIISSEYGADEPSRVFILSQGGTVKFITIIND